MPKKRAKKSEDISEADLMFEINEDNRLRSIGIDPDTDSIDIMIALDRNHAKFEAERAVYLRQQAAKEAEAMAYVEMVMKLRKRKKAKKS